MIEKIDKITAQVSRYEQYRCWKCGSDCKRKDGFNKCLECANLCDSQFYLEEIGRILKGEENALY